MPRDSVAVSLGSAPRAPSTAPSMWAAFRRDLDRYIEMSAAFQGRRGGRSRRISAALTPPLLCCLAHRISHLAHRRGWRRAALAVARWNQVVHKAWITPGCRIEGGLYIPHTVGIALHAHAGRNLTVYAGAAAVVADRRSELDVGADAPVLGDGVTLGAYAVVIGGVRLGSGVKVAPMAVVSGDVPEGATAYRLDRSHVVPGT